MGIETTVCMSLANIERLGWASRVTGLSLAHIVRALLERMMLDKRVRTGLWGRVRYQARGADNNMCRLHVAFREDVYEYNLDMRKAYKMSVSLILAIAIERYLDSVVRELSGTGGSTDNYRFNSYVISKDIVDGVICWKSYWGFPTKIPELALQE